MKKLLLFPCLMLTAPLFWNCTGGPAIAPGSAADGSALSGRTSGDRQPVFYTVTWAPEDEWIAKLSTIDIRTGVGTPIATFQIDPNDGYADAFVTPYGVAFDVDGTMYTTVNWFDGVREHSSSRLARVNRLTGELTYIGDPYPMNFAGPEMDKGGNIYSTGFTVGDPATGGEPPIVFGDSYLYTLDKNTGEATRIGDTGHTEWMDLEFDSQGRLWSTFGNKLYTLDTQTGASTFVTDIVGVPQDNVPGVCPEDWPYMEVMSLAFDEHDVLWATAIRGFSNCEEVDTPVMRIDTETGLATVVGYTHLGYNHAGDIMPAK
ncbi:MAG: hypothetical protein HOC74_18705 [Gemmatimonadetes bacterium]|nr:hypothetical protein [Gemmatimonadota bacterium]